MRHAAGPALAIGKFDALHLGHRALAQRAATLGEPGLLQFSGMAEVLGWPQRLPLVASSATRSASRIPERPATMPHPNQAEASTRRTGTPRVAVISRSLAMALIAVPSLE